MRDGFVKIAAGTPNIRVADCMYNAEQIVALMREAAGQGVKVLALPELCITAYTCADLFLQPVLLQGAERALEYILNETSELDLITAVGMPIRCRSKLYNCAVMLSHGEILGVVPKSNIPNYSEFYEARWFVSGQDVDAEITLCDQTVTLSAYQLFRCQELPELCIGVEICEDLWVPVPPSSGLATAGATVILNLSASDETVCKDQFRRNMVSDQSGRLICAYVYADAGEGESTTDLVFVGHDMIAENGALLAESRFQTGLVSTEVDVHRLTYERQRITTFPVPDGSGVLPGADPHQANPLLRSQPLCPRRHGRPHRSLSGDLFHGLSGTEKASGAHSRQMRRHRPVWRPGLHLGTDDHQQRHEDAGASQHGYRHPDHALLRHHRPHPGQRHQVGRAAGHDLPSGGHW